MQSVSNSLLPCGISLKIIIINNLVIPNLIEICVSSLELSAYPLDSLMRKYRINIIKLVVEVKRKDSSALKFWKWSYLCCIWDESRGNLLGVVPRNVICSTEAPLAGTWLRKLLWEDQCLMITYFFHLEVQQATDLAST